jgi:hypothetical protein
MSYEQTLITKIEAGIRAVKGKRKSPKEAGLASFFVALKPLNQSMHDDLMSQYKTAIDIYNTPNESSSN